MRAVHLPFDRFNPYQRALANGLAASGVEVEHKPLRWLVPRTGWTSDVVHFHWIHALINDALWKFVIGFPLFVGQLFLLRLKGCRIVWTVHNLMNHEKTNSIRDRLVSLAVGHMAHRVIVHGNGARPGIWRQLRIPSRKIVVIPHGNYIGIYPNEIQRQDARRSLGIADTEHAFLFLGNIRPYKGVEHLIATFRSLDVPNSMLIIAGRPLDEETERRIRTMIDNDARIQFHPGYLEPERIQIFMNAADAVVLPYLDILSSGAVVMAMSFSKPCVAPAIGCIPDCLDERGAFIYDPTDSGALRSALARAITAAPLLQKMGDYNFGKAQQWSWESVAAATARLYSKVQEGESRKGGSR